MRIASLQMTVALLLAACAAGCSSGPTFATSKAPGTASGASATDSIKNALHLGGDKQTKPPKPSAAASDEISLSTPSGPPGPELYVALAKLYERKGSVDKAVEFYQKALDPAPNYLPALVGYAHLEDRRGKLVEATDLYERAAKAHPTDAAVLNDLALCLARRNMYRESVETLSRAIELEPEKKLYRNNIATVLVKMGRMDEAFAQLKAVHGEAIAYYNMGFLLEKKDRQQAAYHYAKAQEKDPSLTVAAEALRRVAGGMAPESPRGTPGPALVRADGVAARPAAGSPADPRSSAALAQPSSAAVSRSGLPDVRVSNPGVNRVALTPEAAPLPEESRQATGPSLPVSQPERESAVVIRLPRDTGEAANGAAAAMAPSPDALDNVRPAPDAPEAVQPLPAVQTPYSPPSRY